MLEMWFLLVINFPCHCWCNDAEDFMCIDRHTVLGISFIVDLMGTFLQRQLPLSFGRSAECGSLTGGTGGGSIESLSICCQLFPLISSSNMRGVYFAHNEKLPIADCHFNSSFGCYFVYRLLLFQQSEKFAGKVGGGGLEMGIWVTLLLGLPKWVSKNGVEPFFFAWHSVLHFLNERRTFIDVMFRPFLPHANCINNKFGRKSKGFSFQNPVAHTWSEPSHIKRRFCCVCRKRTDDTLTVECEGNSLIELNFPELIDRCWRQWLFGDLFWKNEALHSALLTRAYSDYKNCVLIKMCTFI